jgi:membrane protein
LGRSRLGIEGHPVSDRGGSSFVGRVLRLYSAFKRDGGVRLGAAVAYYSLFAAAPILILAVAGAQALLGREPIISELQGLLTDVMGDQLATALADMLRSSASARYETSVGIVGAGLLLWAIGVAFGHLQASFNAMWHVRQRAGAPIGERLSRQLPRLAFVLLPAAALLAMTLMSAVLSWATERIRLGSLDTLVGLLGSPLSVGAAAWLSLALLYRFLPDARIRLRDVLLPALLVSVAWTLGTQLYGAYLTLAGTQSATGAAGAVFLLLVWMNYSARAVLFGCWMCRWVAEQRGTLEPLGHAERVPTAAEG